MSQDDTLDEVELMTDAPRRQIVNAESPKQFRWDNLTEKQVQHLAGSLRSEYGRGAVKVVDDGSTNAGVVELTIKG